MHPVAFWLATFAVFLVSNFRYVESVSHPVWTKSEEFCYDPDDRDCGPSVWEGVCTKGHWQSPIDIHFPRTSVSEIPESLIHLNEFYGFTHKHFFGRSTGHSFQVQLTDNKSAFSHLKLNGAAHSEEYTFAQLHFHWGQSELVGSEHTLFGQRFPMELHLVHYKSKYKDFVDAMHHNESDAISVFAVFVKLDSEDNPALNGIVSAVETPEATDFSKNFQKFSYRLNVESLLPRKLNFVRYLGSLTTPPCTENVIWTVFTHPISISENQLESFRQVEDEEGETYVNFRPIQNRNSRAMLHFKGSKISAQTTRGQSSTIIPHKKSHFAVLIFITTIWKTFMQFS